MEHTIIFFIECDSPGEHLLHCRKNFAGGHEEITLDLVEFLEWGPSGLSG
jgi:hypothetical protein